jgi:hypothetical protein
MLSNVEVVTSRGDPHSFTFVKTTLLPHCPLPLKERRLIIQAEIFPDLRYKPWPKNDKKEPMFN